MRTRTTPQGLRKELASLRRPPERQRRLRDAELRIKAARRRLRSAASALERVDAELEMRSSLIAARQLLTREWIRSLRSGPALRSGLRGQSERRLQIPIGRDAETRAGRRGLEVRDSGAGTHYLVEITGRPIIYNQPYLVRDEFGEFLESMNPGVAKHLVDRADCRFLVNHSGLALARTPTTLKLEDTPEALRFSAIVDTRQRAANDLVIAVSRGDVSQMSVGFVVADDSWSDDWSQRSIHRFEELMDISAVTYPASPTTSISLVGSGVSA